MGCVLFLSLLVNVARGKCIVHSLAPCCLARSLLDAVFIANWAGKGMDLTELELHPRQFSLQEKQ